MHVDVIWRRRLFVTRQVHVLQCVNLVLSPDVIRYQHEVYRPTHQENSMDQNSSPRQWK